jgi:acid phosphatase (class A)
MAIMKTLKGDNIVMSFINRSGLRRLLFVFTCAAIIAGCASYEERLKPTAEPELGYLPRQALPNSVALLPPPPGSGSVAFALDEEYSRKSFALRNTPAWTLATSDADLMFPHAAGTFSCALNAQITEKDTPLLYMLLRRVLTDAGLSTYAAKDHYKRSRPFVLNKEPICTPEEEAWLEKNGSYPSGHNAIGMAWALILTEISPEQTDAILSRGRAFGLSRIICNVHWYSDTLQGRNMGADTVARLHADPKFRADLEAAKAELEAARAKGLKPTRDCSAEAEAVALQRSLVQ